MRSRAALIGSLILSSMCVVQPSALALGDVSADAQNQTPTGWIRAFTHSPHETPDRMAIAETFDGPTKARLVPELAKALAERGVTLDTAAPGEQPTLLSSASRRDGRAARKRDPRFQIAPPREANIPEPQLLPAFNINRPRPLPAVGPSLLVEIHVLSPKGQRLWSGYAEAGLSSNPGAPNHPNKETALGAAMIAELAARLGANAVEDNVGFALKAD